jgi:hypothetical protein
VVVVVLERFAGWAVMRAVSARTGSGIPDSVAFLGRHIAGKAETVILVSIERFNRVSCVWLRLFCSLYIQPKNKLDR